MTFGLNGGRDAADGFVQMCDVGADMSVAPRHDACQPPFVVGHYQRQSVQFPRYPNGSSVSPLHEFCRLLGLGQREGRVLMFLFLSLRVVFAYLLCWRVG